MELRGPHFKLSTSLFWSMSSTLTSFHWTGVHSSTLEQAFTVASRQKLKNIFMAEGLGITTHSRKEWFPNQLLQSYNRPPPSIWNSILVVIGDVKTWQEKEAGVKYDVHGTPRQKCGTDQDIPVGETPVQEVWALHLSRYKQRRQFTVALQLSELWQVKYHSCWSLIIDSIESWT